MHADASERFTIRSYQPGDESAILDLFARSFHQPRTVESWRWKYQRGPLGRERVSLAFDGTHLVGHYSGYPVVFRDGSVDREANQIGDTMTDPSIRHIGRGPTSILGRTALHFYEQFCEGRVAFNFGFNVANIQKFSLRFLRSDRVEPVTYRFRDLHTLPMPRLSRLERWIGGVSLAVVTQLTSEWDEFFERVAPGYGFLVRRDSTWLRWRYLDSPGAPYVFVAIRKWRRLAGWLVFRIRDRRMTIGDLLIDPDHAGLLDMALRHLAPLYPVDALEGWFPPRPAWLHEALVRLHMEIRPEPQDLSVMCVPFTLPEATERMRAALYYTMGDGDLF